MAMIQTLFACNGTGSAMVEAMLRLTGEAYELKVLPWEALGPAGEPELVALNPTGQTPTMVLSDGQILTESAAIALYLSEIRPEAQLAPPPGHPLRPTFLRRLLFLGTALYAPFTFGDFPQRWVSGDAACDQLRQTTTRHRQQLWLHLEHNALPSPWLMGADFSVLDLYIGVMTRWSPKRPWFAENCPKLADIAGRVDQDTRFAEIWQRNFPGPA